MIDTALSYSVEAAPPPPWMSPEAFPSRPLNDHYGYMAGGKLRSCSGNQLVTLCSRDQVPPIHLVWTPESPRLVPPGEVLVFFDALKTRAKKRYRTQLVTSIINMLFLGILPLMSLHADARIRKLLIFNCLVLGVLPLTTGVHSLFKIRRLTPEQFVREQPLTRYAAWVRTRKIVLTWVLAAGILGIFIAQMFNGMEHSVAVAGLVKENVRHGQFWRLGTAAMLHGNFIHILFNGLALLGLGRLTEVLVDWSYLAIVFLASILAGSLLSLVLLPHTSSVGASGGLLGLIGFFVVFGYRHKTILPPSFLRSILINVLLVAAMGVFAYDIIDNAAHVGGFVCGVLLGLVMIPARGGLPQRPTKFVRGLGGVCTVVLVGLIILTGGLVLHRV